MCLQAARIVIVMAIEDWGDTNVACRKLSPKEHPCMKTSFTRKVTSRVAEYSHDFRLQSLVHDISLAKKPQGEADYRQRRFYICRPKALRHRFRLARRLHLWCTSCIQAVSAHAADRQITEFAANGST